MVCHLANLSNEYNPVVQAKVRARLSRPLQRPPRMKHGLRGNFRVGHGASRGGRLPYARPPPLRRPPPRLVRPAVGRLPPIRSHPLKRPVDIRDRRPVMSMPDRARRLPPPERSYDRRPPGLQALCAFRSFLLQSNALYPYLFSHISFVDSSSLPKEKSKERIRQA